MPLYQYQCTTCGKIFELIQRFSDAPLMVHEECGGRLEKLVSAPALHFKGSGWYVNDYAKAAPKQATDGNTAEAKPDGTKDATSESKSEAQKDQKSDRKKPDGQSESKPAAAESKSEPKPAATTKKD